MYTPKPFEEADLHRLRTVVEANSFGLLVSNGPDAPTASHLPFMIDLDTETGQGTLSCHMARANPHWQAIEADPSVLSVFSGTHGYISPRWYTTPLAVPTWNYVSVHVYGQARTEHDPAALREHLERLVAIQEAGRPEPWSLAEPPDGFIDKMLTGLVGVEIAIERIEGKRKMSQNRTPADQAGVIAALRSDGTERGLELAAEMAPEDFSWYRNDA